MRTLVIGEWEHGSIADATLRVVAAMTERGLPVDLLTFSADMAGAAQSVRGVAKVLVAGSELPNAESLAALLQRVSGDYSMIAASHRTAGRAALPRAAALTGSAFLSDLTSVIDARTFIRGLYAGSVVARVKSESAITFATVRASSFMPVAIDGEAVSIEMLEAIAPFNATRLVERTGSTLGGRELSSAQIVIAGGRGMASKDNMDKLALLADNMGAALGASRAAVDAGYAPNAAQVGQTGKTVAPDVYVALGISGAIQHLAGMKDSQIIVAVNKDPDAPIFSVADYGIVGDLFDVMGELDAQAQAFRALR